MKLCILNGSPRGKKSNSKRMSDWICANSTSYSDLEISEYFLNQSGRQENILHEILDSDAYLFVFPLYVDSMPAIVKAFMEKMSLHNDSFSNKPIYFIIHSGFPEMIQSEFLKKYNHYFSTKIMQMDYKGTLIMAGSESLQMAPDQFFQKKIPLFSHLLDVIIQKDSFDESLSLALSTCYKMTRMARFLFSINPAKDFYWNYRLKKSGARHLAKAKPYL